MRKKILFSEEKEIEKAVLFLIDCVRKNCKNLKPVIWHSLKVGYKLYELGETKQIVIAGILHDLLEDTDCQSSKIKNKFGSCVAKLVKACTFDSRIKNYKKRWHKSINNIKRAGKKAMLIKVVDANDNLNFIHLLKDVDKLKEVFWKQQLIIESFKPKLGKLKIFKEYERNLIKLNKFYDRIKM